MADVLCTSLEIEARWCVLPPWIRTALLHRAKNDPSLSSLARHAVFLAHHAHLTVHRRLSTPSRHAVPSQPKYFSLLLEESPQEHTPSHPPRRIVLLHGWHMSHKDWKQTAGKLHRVHGFSVLLVDFIGHGHSPYLSSYDEHVPALLVHQVRDAVVRANWHSDPSVKVTFAGISMGGAVSLRYAQLYPSNVDKIILLSAAGMPVTRFYAITPYTGPLTLALVRRMNALCRRHPTIAYWINAIPVLHKAFSHIHLVQHAPTHQVHPRHLDRLLSRFVSAAVWAHVDMLHPLQLELFPTSLRVRIVPWVNHALFCKVIDFLQLDQDIDLWTTATPQFCHKLV
ncbi:hypothetical protein DYB34_008197 [Aphanomyces astaci]|uniref:Serine aminopeptidase S33 domain-containing protein n=1 Tax=Aphanomyces astaci TaxID=112090 RepID=A0A418BYC6_APHAT|nr:hypothetical protein DYB34_008197 [Aphanomyces astaci]